ncbi:MAG: four helix bundle protein [Firmicutes bacterium]|nr:four helix bundle protein [Bacillota bacterium]
MGLLMTIQKFEDLIAWQKARLLAIEIQKIIKNPIFYKDFDLINQILRSSRSIMTNIAEGYGRYSFREYKHFLTIARGSLTETQNHLYIALDSEYINKEEFHNLYNLTIEVYRLINGLIAHLKLNKSKQAGV